MTARIPHAGTPNDLSCMWRCRIQVFGRRRRWLLGAASVLAVAVVIGWLIRSPVTLQDPGGALDEEEVHNEVAMTVGASVVDSAETPTAVATDDIDSGEAAAALWQAVDESSVEELPAYKEIVEDRVLIRITGATTGWEVGQRVTIPVPQIDEIYMPVIERIVPGPAGIRSFVGKLTEDDNRNYRFTITTGPRNSFANLYTPFGGFELVATGELGWLMPAANMDQHVDYSIPDYVIPEQPVNFER